MQASHKIGILSEREPLLPTWGSNFEVVSYLQIYSVHSFVKVPTAPHGAFHWSFTQAIYFAYPSTIVKMLSETETAESLVGAVWDLDGLSSTHQLIIQRWTFVRRKRKSLLGIPVLAAGLGQRDLCAGVGFQNQRDPMHFSSPCFCLELFRLRSIELGDMDCFCTWLDLLFTPGRVHNVVRKAQSGNMIFIMWVDAFLEVT